MEFAHLAGESCHDAVSPVAPRRTRTCGPTRDFPAKPASGTARWPATRRATPPSCSACGFPGGNAIWRPWIRRSWRPVPEPSRPPRRWAEQAEAWQAITEELGVESQKSAYTSANSLGTGTVDRPSCRIAVAPVESDACRKHSAGAVAQLGERSVRNAEVEGSSPFRSTRL